MGQKWVKWAKKWDKSSPDNAIHSFRKRLLTSKSVGAMSTYVSQYGVILLPAKTETQIQLMEDKTMTMTMRDGILEELVDAVKSLRGAIVAQTEVIKKLTSVQASEKRQRLTVDVVDNATRNDLEFIFNALFYVDQEGEVSRGDILRQLESRSDPRLSVDVVTRTLIDSYNLTKVQSKGYRAFIEIARRKARREFFRDGSPILSGISLRDPDKSSRDPVVDLKALEDKFRM